MHMPALADDDDMAPPSLMSVAGGGMNRGRSGFSDSRRTPTEETIGANVKNVEHIRKFFPETWLWTELDNVG